MCKIAAVAAVNDENRDNVWAMMICLGDIMSRTQRDGLGYAAFDKSGKIFGERWLENSLSFTDFSANPRLTAAKIAKNYNFFGEKVLRKEAQAIILHARAATCGRGLANTHPFVNDEQNVTSAIIHNGIIANHEEHIKKTSTCDSEILVHLYEKFKISENLANIRSLVNELVGWFTVLTLSKDSTGRPIIDVYTDAPRLSSYFVKELGTRVYSTSSYDIEEAAEILGFEVTDRQTIRSETAYRLDALTGATLEEISFAEEKADDSFETARNVYVAEGNFDDEKFRNNYLKRSTDI